MVVENQSHKEDKRTEARARQQRTLRAMGDFFQGCVVVSLACKEFTRCLKDLFFMLPSFSLLA